MDKSAVTRKFIFSVPFLGIETFAVYPTSKKQEVDSIHLNEEIKMKKQVFLLTALFLLASLNAARAQVQVGVNIGGGGDSFHLAIGDYYHAPPDQVNVCVQQRIPDEEQPVVFYVAQRAGVAPGAIIDLRVHGMPWVDILHRYRLSPRIFYVPIRGSVYGTPYERFYAYYNGRGPRVRLLDADIVNMVNLRFASEYYHRTPEEIIRLRAGGRSFAYIHDQYHGGYHGDRRYDDHQDHPHHFNDDHDRNHRDDGYSR